MQITVLFGGDLRYEGGKGQQLIEVDLPTDSHVEDLLLKLNLPMDRVKIIMVNGRGGTVKTPIREGDRVALFPPELAFNTFVSMGFRKESVERREN